MESANVALPATRMEVILVPFASDIGNAGKVVLMKRGLVLFMHFCLQKMFCSLQVQIPATA
eukprot:4187635-Pleurochrysis_carterae.AAC.1